MTVNHGVPGSSPGRGARSHPTSGWLFYLIVLEFCVYIIYSEKLDRYYIGTSDSFEKRFNEHNNAAYLHSFTSKGVPWTKYLVIDGLSSKQAFAIEQHIKKMKSRKYMENLKLYPEMIINLKEKFYS